MALKDLFEDHIKYPEDKIFWNRLRFMLNDTRGQGCGLLGLKWVKVIAE